MLLNGRHFSDAVFKNYFYEVTLLMPHAFLYIFSQRQNILKEMKLFFFL